MLVLGLNAYHGDAAACLVEDGRLVAAVEEERLRRIKHWAGFPSEAIKYCLAERGVRLADIEHIAINSDPSFNFGRKLLHVVTQRPNLAAALDRARNMKKRQSVEAELAAAFPSDKSRATIHRVEHHLSHMASTFLVSPFREAAIVSVDGFGDFSSAAWGSGRDNAMTVDGRVYFPHSLGVFYQALTQFLGFPHYGDEYKVMGLAPYGEDKFSRQMGEIVRLNGDGSFSLELQYFRHHNEKIAYEWSGGSPHVGTLFSPALQDLLGPVRGPDQPLTQHHKDIARSTQAMFERALFHLLGKTWQKHPQDNLTLAGGCAMNSVANGKVRRATRYKNLYIQSAAGDAGGAIGAAMQVWATNSGAAPPRVAVALKGDDDTGRMVMDHAYWGPHFSNEEIGATLASAKAEIDADGGAATRIDDEKALCQLAGRAIANGDVVGWFQGRLEWGPRALGNRSIVCDPRRADMKDILNSKIKRRESFRPFAPSIQREHVGAWFEEDDDVPFMMQVYQIREGKRIEIPAVTHADGSGRLQTVYKSTNPRYWALIEAFRELTGVPIVLNTSFNENEPVVCTPAEALACFLRTKMDLLVLNNWVVRRTQA